jgi:hypothetical protein
MTGDLILRGDPVEENEASTKKYVDDRMENVTGLVDKNRTDGAIYNLDIDNNRVNFYRGDGTDKYLEIFSGADVTDGALTISGKRDSMRFPTVGITGSKSEWIFSSGTDVSVGSPYVSSGIFRIVSGVTNG